MAQTVIFKKNNTTVKLPAPAPGAKSKLIKHQATGLSAAGQRYVYDKGVERQTIELTLRRVSTADKDALLSFFHSMADGMMETFTYADDEGTAWTARFIDTELAVDQVRNDQWQLKVSLEVS